MTNLTGKVKAEIFNSNLNRFNKEVTPINHNVILGFGLILFIGFIIYNVITHGIPTT